MTPLARALAAMNADPEDAALRLAFFHQFAASEVHVPGGAHPQVFDTSDGLVILAFDSEEALADFAQGPVERASLPGRALVAALDGQGVGVTLEAGDETTLLDPATLAWLARTLGGETEADAEEDRLSDPTPPRDLSPALLAALDRAFPRLEGVASRAWLFEDGPRLVLAIEGAAEASHLAVSRLLAEAVRLSDWDGALDVTFIDGVRAEALKGRALRIDLPKPPARPARDPDLPPRLR